jgi:LmbE family N-acetylglucosaminyl deacetylase
VFFGAHAGDIELGAGGTCAKLCSAGFDVRIVVATDDKDPAVASTRRNEAIAAAAMLGVHAERIYFLGMPDGEFRCNRDTIARVRALFASLDLRPDVVFTHTEADSYQDHVELTRIVKGALRRVAMFKYRVRNSAVPSHSVAGEGSRYGNLRSSALRQHVSQITSQRIDLLSCQHNEVFELEIQEGAADYSSILDYVNDAPFSRLWMPLCGAAEPVTIITQSCEPSRWYNPICGHPRRMLQLVTRLQNDLLQRMRAQLSVHSISAHEEETTALDGLSEGTSVILGGPFENAAARAFCNQAGQLRYRFDPPSMEYLIDGHTGTVFEPMFRFPNATTFELMRDYGLLTISRLTNKDRTRKDRLVIAAMGVHAPGTAAAFSCLLVPQLAARIVDDARSVIEGRAYCAQWVVPCNANSSPVVSEIESHVDTVRPPQSAPLQIPDLSLIFPAASETIPCSRAPGISPLAH